MKVHLIIHEAFEGPGAILNWIEERGFRAVIINVYESEPMPQVDDLEMLIVMGGPQAPTTTKQECAYFDAQAEMKLIQQATKAGKKVLGVCLGSQLISNALGGNTSASPIKEIGLFPVQLTEEGKSDPVLSEFPETFMSGHWHCDMSGLTNKAVVLAGSKGCPRQIVRFAKGVYGFQCHLEFTPEAIEDMISNCSKELEESAALPFVQNADQLRKNDYKPTNELLFAFLDRFIES